jgi:SPP1 family predicted phage head-tail adaptor
MRWRMQLQQFTDPQDAYGQPKKSWATVGTYWAKIRSPNGREATNAAQMKAELTHVITVRWPGISLTLVPKMRYLYKGRAFNITWINNVDERNRQLDVYCQEVVSPP